MSLPVICPHCGSGAVPRDSPRPSISASRVREIWHKYTTAEHGGALSEQGLIVFTKALREAGVDVKE
jgi:hypothetical protein